MSLTYRRVWWHTFLLLLFSVITGTDRCRAQVNAEQVMAIGCNVLSMEDYMLSIQYFNQAIKAKPYLSDPYYYRALAKLSLEDYKGAEEDCTLAIERNKFKTEPYRVRGFARQYLGKDSLAVEDYDVGLAYNPGDKYFLFYKAVAQTELGRNEGADSTFATLLRLFPRFDDGYTARARLLLNEGDTVAAAADLDRAIDLSPNSVRAVLMRAELAFDRRDWEAALKDMDEAVRLEPREADFYLNRAFVRYNLDDWFGAMADYNYAIELAPEDPRALFNRALLRYEVKDLDRAADDFSRVLIISPDNFHARFNLGLVDLERKRPAEALDLFNAIATRYPRFYPVYYARAEAYRDLGNMRAAMADVRRADDMVKGYVKDPTRNPLDRPTISPGRNSYEPGLHADESDTEVMERFNQLVTVAPESKTTLSFNERIRGRVQDREMSVEPEPSYTLTFIESPASLKSTSNYFRELDDLNSRRYLSRRIFLSPRAALPTDQKELDQLFGWTEYYTKLCDTPAARPVDFIALGMLRSMLKDFQGAERSFTRALESNPDFTVALIGRADARSHSDDPLRVATAIDDYDHALRINPRLIYAAFNKGNIMYARADYTSAIDCFTQAIGIDPTFGQAYFNRGLAYFRLGNKAHAFDDLSKAGELGVIPAYSLLKRMK